MGRSKQRRSVRPADRFTNIPNYVLDHIAVRTLPPAAFKVMLFLAKRCYGAKNNGSIVFGARSGCLILDPVTRKYEENEIGMKKSATAAALRELQRRGLIECMKASQFDQKKLTQEYRLTWIKTADAAATNDFFRYREDGEIQKPVRQNGLYQGQ